MQEKESKALQLLREYLNEPNAKSEERALDAVKQQQLSNDEANEAFDLLANAKGTFDVLDSLAATLLATNVSARRAAADRLETNVEDVLRRFLEVGENSFDTITSLPCEKDLWRSSDAQSSAQNVVLRFCVRTLAGENHYEPECLMKSIARLVSVASLEVIRAIDVSSFDTIFSYLDFWNSQNLRSLAILSSSKLLQAREQDQDREKLLRAFIQSRVSKNQKDQLIVAFSAAAALFPIATTVVSSIFLADGFVQQVVPALEQRSGTDADGIW